MCHSFAYTINKRGISQRYTSFINCDGYLCDIKYLYLLLYLHNYPPIMNVI